MSPTEWNECINLAVKRRHNHKSEILYIELRAGSGYGADNERRIDAWAINAYPSTGVLRTAYEFKTSRSDFLHEIKKPNKRRQAMRFSNEYYFITPPGIVKDGEIPFDCGHIVVDERGNSKVLVPAPTRDSCAPSWRFVASVARRTPEPKLEEICL